MSRKFFPKTGLNKFIIFYIFIHVIIFQIPAFGIVSDFIDMKTLAGMAGFLCFQVLQIYLLFVLLALLSLLGQTFFKIAVGILFFINIIAFYYIYNFGIFIDDFMIANILATHNQQTSAFLAPNVVIPFAVVAALIGFFLWHLHIDIPRRVTRLWGLLGATAVFCLVTFPLSFAWPNVDALAQRVGGKILPWSYIFNSIRYIQNTSAHPTETVLLPAAQFLRTPDSGMKDVVILIIGESARRQNLAYYGNENDTSEFTKSLGMVALQDGRSCDTNTIATIKCMLSHQGHLTTDADYSELLPSYLTRHGVETIVRRNNTGIGPISVTDDYWANQVVETCTENCPIAHLDEALLWDLPARIESAKSNRVFVLLHLQGSHGPSYMENVPSDFRAFTPYCAGASPYDCDPQALKNAYDTTILYTDSLIAKTITDISSLPNARSIVFYVSDHGESLGEDGIYMHSTPKAFAGDEQFEIPFLVWISDAYQGAYKVGYPNLPKSVAHPDSAIFHSVMGAFGMVSPIYDAQNDILAKPQ